MSMYLEFEPHSWYMGAAIQQITLDVFHGHYVSKRQYRAFVEDGNAYRVVQLETTATLEEIKAVIRNYWRRDNYKHCPARLTKFLEAK